MAMAAALPVLGIMRLLQRVAHACVARREHLWALACRARRIQLHLHKLIHVLQHQHIRVQLYHTVIFGQREWRKLAPAVVEARVVCVVLVHLRKQIRDILLRDAAPVECLMPFLRERVCVERDKRVLGALLLQAVVEREEAAEVGGIGDQSSPDYIISRYAIFVERCAYLFLSLPLARR